MIAGQIKPGRDFAQIGALTDQIGAPAPAEHEAETVEKDGFTGAGFAGQHIQAGLEFQLQPPLACASSREIPLPVSRT